MVRVEAEPTIAPVRTGAPNDRNFLRSNSGGFSGMTTEYGGGSGLEARNTRDSEIPTEAEHQLEVVAGLSGPRLGVVDVQQRGVEGERGILEELQ